MAAHEFFGTLTDEEDAFAKEHGALPKSRCALYGGSVAPKKEVRFDLWDLGVCVRDTPVDLNSWIDSIKAWPSDEAKEGEDGEEEEEEAGASGAALDFDDDPPPAAPTLVKQMSSGSERLDVCRARLAAIEAEQQTLETSEEARRKDLATSAAALFEKLEASVAARRQALVARKAGMRSILSRGTPRAQKKVVQQWPESASSPPNSAGGSFAGPRSGRDAALAEAWFEGAQDGIASWRETGGTSLDGAPDATQRRRLLRAVKWLDGELESLQQVVLAAKVVALIPSPEQIKYLNLTHDWLRTFLPHCLQKGGTPHVEGRTIPMYREGRVHLETMIFSRRFFFSFFQHLCTWLASL